MSWNSQNYWGAPNVYNRSNQYHWNELNYTIDGLREELAMNDYILTNELQSDLFCDYDRQLLAAELYKERLLALTTAARSQVLVVQMGAALMNQALSNRNGGRWNGWNQNRLQYNQNTVSCYNPPQRWRGQAPNNNNAAIQPPMSRQSRKRKRKAPQANVIPVKVSRGPDNTGIATAKTTTAPNKTTAVQANKATTLVKTTSAQVPTSTTSAHATITTPAPTTTTTEHSKNVTTPMTTITTQITVTSAKVKTFTTQVKTVTATKVLPQAKIEPALDKTSSKPSIFALANTAASGNGKSKPDETISAAVVKTAPDDTVLVEKTVPANKAKSPGEITSSQLKTACARPHRTSTPIEASHVPVKTEPVDTNVSQQIPSLFSLNLSHIKLRFSEADRIILNPYNIPEPIPNFCSNPIKTEDDSMRDDLEDHI